MMLRQLLSVAPGEVKFCVFDPVGLGQSAGELLDLAEYHADLIGGKVWSSSRDLEAQLTELSAHIELVIQKYLRTTYQTIDEFNDAAGEVAEPYRMLILFDSPNGLTSESAARLKSIVANGPRCGVFTLMAVDASVQAPYGVDMTQLSTSMRKLNLQGGFSDNLDGYQLEASFEHDVLPERTEAPSGSSTALAEQASTGPKPPSRSTKCSKCTATSRREDCDPNWATLRRGPSPGTRRRGGAITAHAAFSPLGQKGARDVAVLGSTLATMRAPCSSAALAPANQHCCTRTLAA